MKSIAGAGCGARRWSREQAIVTGGKIRARARCARIARVRDWDGWELEKSVRQGGVDQPDRGRLARGAGCAGSGGLRCGVARRTSAAGLSSRRPS
jgi:hypothetical protein